MHVQEIHQLTNQLLPTNNQPTNLIITDNQFYQLTTTDNMFGAKKQKKNYKNYKNPERLIIYFFPFICQ